MGDLPTAEQRVRLRRGTELGANRRRHPGKIKVGAWRQGAPGVRRSHQTPGTLITSMNPGNGTRWTGKSFPSRGCSRYNTRLSSERRNDLGNGPRVRNNGPESRFAEISVTVHQTNHDAIVRPAPPSGKRGSHSKERPADPPQGCDGKGRRKNLEPSCTPAGGRSSDSRTSGNRRSCTREPRSNAPAPLPGTRSREAEAGIHAKPVREQPSSTACDADGGASPLSRQPAAGTGKCGASAGKTMHWARPLSEMSTRG